MKIEIRKKCFVKECNNKIPLLEAFNLRFNSLFCKEHNKIFNDKFEDKEKVDYHAKEINIYKEMGVDMDRLRAMALKHDKNIKSEFPTLFEEDKVVVEAPKQE